MNNFKAIYQLFVTIPVTIFLIIFFYHGDFITKLFLTPFIVCAIATIFKSIFVLKGNKKWTKYCNKVYVISFLTYALGFFLAFWYLAIKNKIYSLIIVLLIISAIIMIIIKNSFFKKKQSKEEMKRENEKFLKKERIKRKLGQFAKPMVFLLLLVLGIVLLFFGIKNWLVVKEETKNYKEVEGYFIDTTIYSSDEDGTTYSLIYYYIVDGEEYQISTSYGTSMIPKQESTRTIKYNPKNPEEASMVGGESFVMLLFGGLMFTIIPLLFLIDIFKKKDTAKKTTRFNFFAFGMGLFFCTLCFGILYMMSGTFSLIKMFHMYGVGFLLPECILTILILAGFYLMGMSVYQAITYKEENTVK